MYAHHTEIYEERFKSFGFNVYVVDGHSIKELVEAITKGKEVLDRPTAIVCKTIKGKGFDNIVEGKLNWHGKDLGPEYEKSLEILQGKIKHEKI